MLELSETIELGLLDVATRRGFDELEGMSTSVKSDSLSPLPAEPKPGRYRHYKGKEYRVIGIARHSETLEPLVVYQALYGERGLWVRPAGMFIEAVAGSDGKHVPRFVWVAER